MTLRTSGERRARRSEEWCFLASIIVQGLGKHRHDEVKHPPGGDAPP